MAFDQIGLSAVLEGVADFVSQGEAVNNSVADMGSGMDVGAGIMSAAGDVITGALMRVGEIAVESLLAAGGAIVDFFSNSFEGALEAEQTIARLGQVIESTGGIAGVTVGEAEALADEFKSLAGGSDDAVISIIDMGLRMGTISEDEMPAFIQSTLDLGAVMGDAGKAALLMARAQEDPVGVLGALRKAGILVNEETEAQIKAMVKAGDTAGAYSILMDRVGEATEGAAEVMANTTAGQWAIFQETIADAGETIMGAFLPALMGIAGPILETVVPAIGEFATSVGNIITLITTGDFTGGIFGWMEDDARVAALFTIRDALIELGVNIQAFVDGFISDFQEGQAAMQPVIDAVMNVVATFADSMPMIQSYVQTMVDFVIGQINILSPTLIANVSSTLNSMAEFWSKHGDAIMSFVATAFEFITVTVGGALTIISGLIAVGLELINTIFDTWAAIFQGDWETAFSEFTTGTQSMQDILSASWEAFLNSVLSIVGMNLEEFKTIWSDVFTMLGIIVQTGFDNVVLFVSEGILSAIAAATAIVSGFVDVGAAMIQGMIDGITGAVGGLVQAAIDAALSAFNAAQEALGISSPSVLAMQLIGKPFSEGIAAGILSGLGDITAASQSVSTEMVSAASPVSNSQVSSTANYYYSPTYGSAPVSPERDFAIMQVTPV